MPCSSERTCSHRKETNLDRFTAVIGTITFEGICRFEDYERLGISRLEDWQQSENNEPKMKADVAVRLSNQNLVYCGALQSHNDRIWVQKRWWQHQQPAKTQPYGRTALTSNTSLSNYVEKYHDCDQIVSILTTLVLGLVMELILEWSITHHRS